MKKIALVDPEVLEQTVKDAKDWIECTRKKKKLSLKDKLHIEYLRTFINNPTPVNYVLLTCGRAEEMKRKEETDGTV